jgi:D-methionine transport system ATP-binding protein
VFLHPQHAVTRSLLSESGIQSETELASLRCHPDGVLLRLTFVGEATYDPVLSLATEATGLHFSILQGTVGRIKHQPYGQLLVETVADGVQLTAALNFFSERQIRHEVLS